MIFRTGLPQVGKVDAVHFPAWKMLTPPHFSIIIIIENDNNRKEYDGVNKSKADLILHPIRMRIIQALLPEGNRTAQQLVERLSNVPQATLYRHLNTLLKAGLIQVVEERKIRGTTEKIYALAKNAHDATPDDVTEKSSDLHMDLFMKFVASMIGTYGEYLGQSKYDMVRDGISFRQVQLILDDEEYLNLLQETRALMAKHSGNEPRAGRRLRNIWTVIVPEVMDEHDNRDNKSE